MPKKCKSKFRLLSHEIELLNSGMLKDITHEKASSKWLYAASTSSSSGNQRNDDSSSENDDNSRRVMCYRHMGDLEFETILRTNQLPSTQPYQTLTRREEGRKYCESYLRSNKTVDTHPTTVVEFNCPKDLIDDFYQIQCKIENGTISHGLGNKAGKTLSRFNTAMIEGDITWRIVLVKRPAATK
mmetsp:Transcript_15473/g.17320  ORF Transcript_15473/g.17320 Transcript_15473/m.17320 type:complete len:185 (+) Transcript_15473:66-620(+)